MELLKITDEIFLVPGRNRGRFPFSHSIFINGERKLLFDCGGSPQVMKRFLARYKIDVFFASHSHPGHIASAWMLTDCPIFAPAQSVHSFGNLEQLAERFVENDGAREIWMKMAQKLLGFRDMGHTHTYDGQTSLDMGDTKLVAIHTPGHTVDHHCFFEERSGLLMGFDIDLSPSGPFYVHRESDLESFRASLQLIRSYQPRLYFSSHYGLLRNGIEEAIQRYEDVIDQRDDQIIEALRDAPMTAEALAEKHLIIPRFSAQLEPLVKEWELNMVKKHLDLAVDRGTVRMVPDGYRAA